MKFISKCYVCGNVYGAVTQDDGKDGERISHGYCSDGCANQVPVQIMYWSKDAGCRVLDEGNMATDGHIYHKMMAIDTLVTINDKRMELLSWDNGMYELVWFEAFTTKEHGNRLLTDAVKKGFIVTL